MKCHLHCGKPNGDPKKQRKKRGVRRGPAEKKWVYDPMTGEKLAHLQLTPNHIVRGLCRKYTDGE